MTVTVVGMGRSAGVALLAAGMMAMGASAAAAETAVENLAGKWSGQGALETSSGARETVKCVVVYEVKSANTVINQNLRCASASYKIDAVTQMKVAGGQLTGTWAESSFGTSGTVAGQVRAGGFTIVVDGGLFSARMSVASGKTSQTLNILPAGLAVTKISIGLKRTGA
jgi:hypothetical protein